MSSNSELFQGSIVALVTPMLVNGEIDETAFKNLIDWHISSGTNGLVIMGTTGESSLVSQQEHIATVALAITHANKRIPIIAGCGSAATANAIELVKKLNPLQPDGYLCVTPYYVKPTQAGLIAHFLKVADVCKAPLLLYNVPGRTACDLHNASVEILAKHPTIVGIKDATGEVSRLNELKKLVGDNFCYLSGDDETAFEFIKAGGQGVITVTGNVAPKQVSDWCRLVLSKDITDQALAKQLFLQLAPLNNALFVEANPIPVKWALFVMNKISDQLRLPLTVAAVGSQDIIQQALQKSAISWTLE